MRRRVARPAGARGGFTLLEVTLAMTALALITAICYGAFHLGVRAVERGEIAVVTIQRLRIASDVLTRQIKSAVLKGGCAHDEDDNVYPFFFGTATSLTFITAAAIQGGGGLSRVTYRALDEPPRLEVSESPYFSADSLGHDPLDAVGDNAAVLLDEFKTMKFQYLYDDGVDTEWKDAWDGREDESLPAAVRIIVEGLPGIENGTWGQEIPVVTAQLANLFGEDTSCEDDDSIDDGGGNNKANGGAGTNTNDNDDNDNEPDPDPD